MMHFISSNVQRAKVSDPPEMVLQGVSTEAASVEPQGKIAVAHDLTASHSTLANRDSKLGCGGSCTAC